MTATSSFRSTVACTGSPVADSPRVSTLLMVDLLGLGWTTPECAAVAWTQPHRGCPAQRGTFQLRRRVIRPPESKRRAGAPLLAVVRGLHRVQNVRHRAVAGED